MRTSKHKIKQAILHPEEEIRVTALAYFTERHNQDETVMPLVIEAVQKYGRDTAFTILRRADSLTQTEATVEWLVDELSRNVDLEDVGNDNYRCAVALILSKTRPELLAVDVVALRNFPEELQPGFLERLEMATWDWEQGWAALEDVGKEARELNGFQTRHARRVMGIIEALAPYREKADEILPLLHRRYRGKNRSLMEWLESPLVELAGAMRLEEAIPILVERLHEDDWEVGDSAQTALQWVGGDKVVEELASQWADGNEEFRRGAAEVLGHIHTDLSAEKCLEFLANERDEVTQSFLADAALANFTTEAIEPVRQMAYGPWDDLTPDESDLRYHLVTASTIMGASFPEYESWYAHAVGSRFGWHDYAPDRIRENFREEEEEEEDEWDDGLDGNDYSGGEDIRPYAEEEPPGLLTPFQHEKERTGRNAPCPCGSGKKYKKCCLRKHKTSITFPIGTIAFYGPDDKTTTRIVAGVIFGEDAEPIIERWVATDVTTNPKVKREMDAFFKKHAVSAISASDGNMGCPHEEGKDFPEGEDCPFCPFWEGKQGSERQ